MRDDLWILALLGVVLAIWYAHYDRVKTAEQTGFVDGARCCSILTGYLVSAEAAFKIYREVIDTRLHMIMGAIADPQSTMSEADRLVLDEDCKRLFYLLLDVSSFTEVGVNDFIWRGHKLVWTNKAMRVLQELDEYIRAHPDVLPANAMIDVHTSRTALNRQIEYCNAQLQAYYEGTGTENWQREYITPIL